MELAQAIPISDTLVALIQRAKRLVYDRQASYPDGGG